MKTLYVRTLTTLASICLLSLACQAQVSKRDALPPRYYADIYLNTTYYEVFFSGVRIIPNLGGTHPWAVAAGWQFAPRWAMQLGYAYTHEENYSNPAYTGTTLSGQKLSGWRSSDRWTHAVPLIIRYNLLSTPESRVRVDIVGGSTWVIDHAADAKEDFIDGQSQGLYSQDNRTQQLYVTLGLAARYAFSRRFEGVFEYSRVRNLKTASEAVHLETTGNKWGLTRSMSLGLRYRFNLGKPTP